ncbi:zinc transporter ZIP1-like [Stegodyphus dumicola]|uniref:zinc transporter ZIP1-like n=1 Tax=Stegodyphus dumicola TaxID=202533 RepID=UPI0015B23770|nr:zinc transporter ZIP1-like [Stegodyphus dumicola]
MSALIVSQVICMFLLLIGTLIFGISPVFVQKKLFQCKCSGETCEKSCRARKGKIITSFLIFFGGGVLLGTCFLHLLPEAREGFESDDEKVINVTENATDEGKNEDHEKFSIPEFIVCCGFFAVYCFEEIVHFFLGGHTHVPTENRAIRSFSRKNSCSSRCSIGELSTSGDHKVPKDTPAPPPPYYEEHHDIPEKISLVGLLTVAALSFHSLFEGFAVGLRPDVIGTWMVFSAIAVHKYVISFVVGLEILANGGKNMQIYIYMSIFALMSPIGMAIAMITQSNVEDSSPLTVSVLNAIATGTLLYVTFFEILQRQEHKDISTWLQLIATFAGFALMCLMQYVSTLV